MVEFGDEKDKKKVLEMSPWSFEKQLVLLQEFKGEQAPKEIQLTRSPFWVQIHNLSLKSRTGETGKAIRATLGEVLDVDVAESGVQWENLGPAKMQDTQNFQYGPWLRGDIIKRYTREEPKFSNKGPWENKRSSDEGCRKNVTEESQVPINTVGVGEEPWSTSGILGKNTMEKETSKLSAFLGVAEDFHEEGRVNNQSKSPGNLLPILGKECVAEIESREIVEELKRWETKTHQVGDPQFEFGNEKSPGKFELGDKKDKEDDGSTSTVRILTDEVKSKKPILVFLAETKASTSRIKGIQHKLELTQGISVLSDGRSGGLAMIWKEGTDIRFKSCSNSHIDVVVYGKSGSRPWRATGFYGQPEASKRVISWSLLESLKKQCDMPWVVFGDFNEITHSDEKLGWLDRDADQMQAFKDCLGDCGLTNLGFVGQRYTWCNERLGAQRTLVRLDRFVANEGWRALFPEAMVFHVSMPASDHCLLELSLKKRGHPKPTKKRFFFESMWTRDDRCREVIETAWDPLRECPMFQLQDRIKSCQIHLQEWNWATFGNVMKALKQKQSRL
nr:hypothetical protein CFP56_14177 [Quercus suber]